MSAKMGETQYVQYAVMNDWERIRAETARSNTRIIKILLFVLILLVSAIVLKSYFQPKVVEKIGLVFFEGNLHTPGAAKGHFPNSEKKQTCTDGETKKEDCNICTCEKNLWACTRMYCSKVGRKTPKVSD